VAAGANTTVPIMINDVMDPDGVGTANINLTFDPTVVHVKGVSNANSDFDMVISNIGTGYTTIGASYYGVPPGPTGDVYLADVTLEAVGAPGATSPLQISIVELLDATPSQNPISATPDDGTFTIHIPADTTAPIVKNPSAVPMIIPEDTDNNPLWGELANLTVEATDESGIANVTVTVNLSPVGKKVKVMNLIGNYTNGILWGIFNYSTNASIGTAGWNGTAYEPYQLEINATDICGNSNTSVSIELTVMKNGDVTSDGKVNLGDGIRMINHYFYPADPKYSLPSDTIADVTGDKNVNLGDGIRMINHYFYPADPKYILK